VGHIALWLQKANVHQRDFNMDEYVTPPMEAEASITYSDIRNLYPMFRPLEGRSFSNILPNQAWYMSPPEINIMLAPPSRQASFEPSYADSGYSGSEGALSPPDRFVISIPDSN